MADPLPHKYPRGHCADRWGLANWPIGFQIAPELPDEGRFTTMTSLVPGKPLRINVLLDRTFAVLHTVVALIEAVDFNRQPLSGRTFDDAILTIGNQYNTLVWMGRIWMTRVSIWPIESYCDFASERPRSIARISNSEWQF
ncbi:MAG: hypothetical protein CMJ81_14620 [Planctomycetaceae bacterium]|nr:hypothetical protein [Planctomycetaceae bacterium]MBP60888.1 hypothetical protein [Planctomycetaceae bacterium]